jgi:hypothetical protein
MALKLFPDLNSAKILGCFYYYLKQENNHISRADFEANLARKINDRAFLNDNRHCLIIKW